MGSSDSKRQSCIGRTSPPPAPQKVPFDPEIHDPRHHRMFHFQPGQWPNSFLVSASQKIFLCNICGQEKFEKRTTSNDLYNCADCSAQYNECFACHKLRTENPDAYFHDHRAHNPSLVPFDTLPEATVGASWKCCICGTEPKLEVFRCLQCPSTSPVILYCRSCCNRRWMILTKLKPPASRTLANLSVADNSSSSSSSASSSFSANLASSIPPVPPLPLSLSLSAPSPTAQGISLSARSAGSFSPRGSSLLSPPPVVSPGGRSPRAGFFATTLPPRRRRTIR